MILDYGKHLQPPHIKRGLRQDNLICLYSPSFKEEQSEENYNSLFSPSFKKGREGVFYPAILAKTLLFLILLILNTHISLSWAECDENKSCLGRALTLTVNTGKGAHYVDITKTDHQKYFDRQMTVEMWMKPQKQEGMTQYIAGLWGPATDKNDVWVIYFTPGDSLVFEINHPDYDLRQVDNTILKIPAADLFDSWNHLSAVFDGETETIYLYINGYLRGSSRNPQYPADHLNKLANPELPIQIGSCNGLLDNDNNRTFRGQIDEFRMWARALSVEEILCQKDMALYGEREDSLMIYYRFNEEPDQYTLCDATARENYGKARSGASCQNSDRRFKTTVIGSPLSITDTLKCTDQKTYRFTVTDTSTCLNRVWMRVLDDKSGNYTIDPPNMYLEPNVPTEFEVTIDADFIGTINSRLQIIPYNWCRQIITVPMKITRIAELDYSVDSLDFGILLAHCQEMPSTEQTMQICNNSEELGSPRNVTINTIETGMPDVFIPIHKNLPVILRPGECLDVTVRFSSGDSTAIYFDSLKVVSSDRCESTYKIPLSGMVQEVISITKADGETRLDSIDFSTECINIATPASNYIWANLWDQDIYIDTILVPEHFTSKSFKFPLLLEPATGYLPNYFRFLPTAPGVFRDSIVFVIKAGECTIHRVVYVTGRGYFADIRFKSESLDFGDVFVGQETTQFVTVENYSEDTLRVSFYLRKGESFFLEGARQITVRPGITSSIPVTFRPLDAEMYYDEVCLFEQRCYTAACIPIQGRGVLERFDFIPKIMNTANVVACNSQKDTLAIKNISNQIQVLSEFVLDDPGGKFKLVDPVSFPQSIDLEPNEDKQFIFDYTPNDLTADRSDIAFLRFKTQDEEEWAAKMMGTSIVPKFFVSSPTVYGTLEVGDTRRDTLTVENISPMKVTLDSISVPDGFVMIYPSYGYLGLQLQPRDSIQLILDFVPTEARIYEDVFTCWTSDPCDASETGRVTGEGIIVPLEVPLSVISFGFVQPCKCKSRQIPLVNQSLVFEMSIDSIWIDGEDINNATPEFFSWSSYFSPEGKAPYSIPNWSRDTLYVHYCPRTTSERSLMDNAARIHIFASGSGWEGEYDTYLSGKRNLMMEPSPIEIVFPPTRVDTFSISQHTFIEIPETAVNPEQLPVTVDSIGFIPDERVFFARDSLEREFPITIDTDGFLPIRIDFKPRAVRNYTARLAIYTSSPCSGLDTTVIVTGNGFAPAFGLEFAFENNYPFLDTLRVINCDTLEVSVFTSRKLPADIVDIDFRIGYDTTKLKYVGAESAYLTEGCKEYKPAIYHDLSIYGGSKFLLKNFCNVDSLRPFIIAKYIPLIDRDTLRITVDSIYFDTEEVILYHLIAESDSGTVVIQKPEFSMLNDIDFGSVQVLDCVQRIVQVENTGDVPIVVNDLLDLPVNVRIISSSPDLDELINTGDTIEITIEYCPTRKEEIDTTFSSESILPCPLSEEAQIVGTGFAPEYRFKTDVSDKFNDPDTLFAQISDTLIIPIYFEKDFSAVRNNTEYWLKDMRFDVSLLYNQRALKYLSNKIFIEAQTVIDYEHGIITLNFENVDSLRAGKIAETEFLVTVPDSISTEIYVSAANFDTDSILFYELIPEATRSWFISSEKCEIEQVSFSLNNGFSLMQNVPNPWSISTDITFTLSTDSYIEIVIYTMQGAVVKRNDFDKKQFTKGTYTINISSEDLHSGIYYYTLRIGDRRTTKSMILIKH
jgi:hypothetical protein